MTDERFKGTENLQPAVDKLFSVLEALVENPPKNADIAKTRELLNLIQSPKLESTIDFFTPEKKGAAYLLGAIDHPEKQFMLISLIPRKYHAKVSSIGYLQITEIGEDFLKETVYHLSSDNVLSHTRFFTASELIEKTEEDMEEEAEIQADIDAQEEAMGLAKMTSKEIDSLTDYLQSLTEK